MAKPFAVAGPSTDTVRDETQSEQMQRLEEAIDRANLAGLPYERIIGEGGPAKVVEFGDVDKDGQPQETIYKRRGE